VLECVKNFFDVIKSLLIKEGHAKVLLDKALMQGKHCKKIKLKKQEILKTLNPTQKYAYTRSYPNL
jgi:hypothetical protein